MSSLTDNLWSNIRWQWWQWDVLGTWKRTSTWFHHWSCPRCCGRPVTSHLGNPLNSRSNVFRLSIVTKQSTQNMILICTSKGNTLPNGLFWGSANPLQFMLTAPSMNVASPLFHLIHLFLGPIPYPRQDLFSPGQKSVPMGGYPLECPFVHVIPRDASLPISSLG